ncbi:MAG TPA: bacillithiol biosynthesis deacetylase BshB1 [Longimicrobiales bacterium]|nr:bacillithiol biosynthesis deacetylase BshB1 [Longimicrobiales bacterium]
MSENGLDLLAIVAHPDDAELLCGGTLIRAGDAGHATGVLDLTGGEAGTAGSASLRSEEAERARRILGLADRRDAGLPDGELENTPAARVRVASVLRELRPDTVIVMWPDGRHPDHRAASQLAYDACFVAGLSRAPVEGAPFRPRKVLYALTYREHAPKPSFVVDITAQMERKLEAIFAYGSQFEGKKGMGEVYPGGERDLRDQIRVHAAYYGGLIRAAYGEPFWTRETMAVDDVVGLAVATF